MKPFYTKGPGTMQRAACMKNQFLDERNLKSLRIFCAVAEAGGFSAAEKTLAMSKASISRHINDVEAVLGVKLCERGPSGFKLTLAGITTLQQARNALNSLARIRAEVDNVRGVLSGNIQVGIVEHIYSEEFDLPNILREFAEQAPNMTPNIHVMPFSQLNLALRERRLDVAIRGMYGADNYFNFHPLFTEHQRLYVLKGREEEKDLPLIYRAHPFIYDLMSTGKYIRGPVASGLEAVACLVASGQYVGVLPEHYAKEISMLHPLVEVKNSPNYSNKLCAIVEKYRPPSAAIDLFVGILKKYCR